MKKYLIFLYLISFPTLAIDLVIGGKTYYIEKFSIEDNGNKLIIPYTIHLSEEAFNQELAECKKGESNEAQTAQSQASSRPKKVYRTYPAYGRGVASSRSPATGSVREGGSRSSAGVSQQPIRVKDSGHYQKILQDLRGGFRSLTRDLNKEKSKRNFH